MKWNYAELSAEAKKHGGPEKFVEVLINSGKKEMLPWVGVAAAGGVVVTIGVQKLIKYFSEKKAQSREEVELAKQEIIKGIRAYDEEQEKLSKENTEK